MIQLNNINKVFNSNKPNEVVAIKSLSLDIKEGEYLTIVGSNGSGKSTLLNIISGAELPTKGTVYIDDTDVTKMVEYKRSKWIARVFQNPLSGTAPDLSIIDNFRLAALRTKSRGLTIGVNADFKKKVKENIAILGMGLENKTEQPIGTLSGGQRQALTLLMGVMDETKILLLDEPTAALDPRSADIIMKTADLLIKEKKLTAILITHNLKYAHQYGTRLIQMSEGEIVKDFEGEQKANLALTDLFSWFV